MNKQQKIELSSDGAVQNKGIHDAAIFETTMSGEGDRVSAIVRCRSEEGTVFVFRIEGVRVFTTTFFGSQNVINDCLIISRRDAQSELAEVKDLERYTFEKYDVLNALIKKGDLTLLQFIPSVGAQIDCICKTVVLEVQSN